MSGNVWYENYVDALKRGRTDFEGIERNDPDTPSPKQKRPPRMKYDKHLWDDGSLHDRPPNVLEGEK